MASNLGASRTKTLLRKNLITYLLLFPTINAAPIFYIFPLFYSLFLSFCDWDLLNPTSFFALENSRELFTPDYCHEVTFKTISDFSPFESYERF